jgi:hypothetical protein
MSAKRYYSASTKLTKSEAETMKQAAAKLGVNTSEYLRHLVRHAGAPSSTSMQLELLSINIDSAQTLLCQLLLSMAAGEKITPDLIRNQVRVVEIVHAQRVRRVMGEDNDDVAIAAASQSIAGKD